MSGPHVGAHRLPRFASASNSGELILCEPSMYYLEKETKVVVIGLLDPRGKDDTLNNMGRRAEPVGSSAPRARPPRACSFGWWLMASADLF
jgi:hypothetical protein